MLFATTAMAAYDFEYELLSGNAEQTVNAGEKIQPIKFKVRNVQEVGPWLLNGLNLQCSETYSFSEWSTCEISGRVATLVPSGVYDMEVEFIDAYNNMIRDAYATIEKVSRKMESRSALYQQPTGKDIFRHKIQILP